MADYRTINLSNTRQNPYQIKMANGEIVEFGSQEEMDNFINKNTRTRYDLPANFPEISLNTAATISPYIQTSPTYATIAGPIALGLGSAGSAALGAAGAATGTAGALALPLFSDRVRNNLSLAYHATVDPTIAQIRSWNAPKSLINAPQITTEDRRSMNFGRSLAQSAPNLYKAIYSSDDYNIPIYLQNTGEEDPVPRVGGDEPVDATPMNKRQQKKLKNALDKRHGAGNWTIKDGKVIYFNELMGRYESYDPNNNDKPPKKPYFKDPRTWIYGGINVLGNQIIADENSFGNGFWKTIGDITTWIPIPGVGIPAALAKRNHWWPYNDTSNQQQSTNPGQTERPISREDSLARIKESFGGNSIQTPVVQPTTPNPAYEEEDNTQPKDTVGVVWGN